MSHLDPTRKASPSELRRFGLLVGAAFLGLAAIVLWRDKPVLVVSIFASVGVALVVIGAAAPRALAAIYAGWMRFALVLSKVTTPIFMGVIYFVLLTPLGAIRRLWAGGRHPLRANRGEAIWVSRPEGARASSLDRQF